MKVDILDFKGFHKTRETYKRKKIVTCIPLHCHVMKSFLTKDIDFVASIEGNEQESYKSP